VLVTNAATRNTASMYTTPVDSTGTSSRRPKMRAVMTATEAAAASSPMASERCDIQLTAQI